MSGYVIAGYAVAIGGLGFYVAATVARLRQLQRPDRRDPR